MKIFLDANIILDLIDTDRGNFTTVKEKIRTYILEDHELHTSCDIFTTVYYVASKKIDSKTIIAELEKILTFLQIIPIDITLINSALALSKKESNADLEDVLQYLCAKSIPCERIVTNDKNFYSGDIVLEHIMN